MVNLQNIFEKKIIINDGFAETYFLGYHYLRTFYGHRIEHFQAFKLFNVYLIISFNKRLRQRTATNLNWTDVKHRDVISESLLAQFVYSIAG